MKLLSIVVPSYNSAEYMRFGLDSLVIGGDEVEVLVIDDGSSDGTAVIADEYEARYPGVVRAIHKPNGGHGSAVNAGLEHATGAWIKVVDSDDWVDAEAYAAVLDTLRGFQGRGEELDVLLSNFVYEKAGKKNKRAVRYTNALPQGRVFGWGEVGRFRNTQYILMHSVIYRTGLLREVGLQLPEHTFYVDNLYAFVPLPAVRSLYYLNVDFYRYFIGREGQSVNEAVMIRRIDQQLRVTRMMLAALPERGTVDARLYAYLLHYFEITCVVASMMLIRSGSEDGIAKKEALWEDVRRIQPRLYRRQRWSILGLIIHLPGRAGRGVSVAAYKVARRVIGFS